MAKYRIVSRGSLVTIKSKLSFGEEVNDRELQLFDKELLHGCFRPRLEGKKTLIYTAPDVIELKKYLKNAIDEETFFEIVAQILEMQKRIEINGLYIHNLMLQMDMVYICERTKELFFIYQPIASRLTSGNVYAFLGDLTQLVRKNVDENVAFLMGFQKFLAEPGNYKGEDIEGYVRKVCPQVFRKIVSADAGKSGFITNDRVMYEAHYHDGEDDEGGTTLLVDEDEGGTTLLTYEEDDEGTTLLNTQIRCPILTRLNTAEQISVDRDYFTIGKESSNDFQITDNKAISRKHAVIEKNNGSYYISDTGSTNHVYLNGQMIEPGIPCELFDGTEIQLADETFTFEL